LIVLLGANRNFFAGNEEFWLDILESNTKAMLFVLKVGFPLREMCESWLLSFCTYLKISFLSLICF